MKELDYQFTGWWIPRELIELYHTGDLSLSELILVAMIHSLARGKEGCTASNGFLADRMKLKVRRIQQMLEKMKAMELIVVWEKNGRRRIKTYFNGGPTPRNPLRPPVQSVAPPSPAKAGQDSKVKHTVARSLDGGFFGKTPKTGFSLKCAKKLYHALATRRLIQRRNPNLKQWAEEFRKLRVKDQVSKAEIKRTLIWFMSNLTERYVPQAYSADSFRKKFDSIHARMTAEQSTRTEREGRVIQGVKERRLKDGSIEVTLDYGQ